MKKTGKVYMLNSAGNNTFVLTQKTVEVDIPPSTEVQQSVAEFARVCRICASTTDFIVPIFSGEGKQNNLAEKIETHLPITVSPTDRLPQHVCVSCAHTLLAWHELEACCRQADVALRTRLQQIQQPAQEPQPSTSRGTRNQKNKGQKQCKPCPHTAETLPNDSSIDGFDTKDDKLLTSTECKDNDTDCSDGGTASISDEENQPLSLAATKKATELYNNFYQALVNFRDHFVDNHKTKSNYPDFTDSSDSELVLEDNEYEEELNVDHFDDLTQSNMRKDRMDEETRLELSQVQTKINGRVYYTCKLCGKNLSSSHTYVFHKRIHTGERPCVCHICGKQFRAPNGLQRHLTETHEKVRRHSCRFCTKNFANSQNLKQHLRIHTGERPFVCSHCGKRFTQSGSLHVHLKTHTEQFPYQCAECGAKFRLRSGLTRHRLKHTGERPHVCTHCGKGFRQKHELNSHVLSHTDSKPFNCALCGAAFRQRRALTHHTKRLHENDQSREITQAVTPRGPNMLVYTHIGQYQ